MPYPSAVAGYEACLELLEGTGVRIKDPRVMTVIPTDPLGLFASSPLAYSVDAYPLPGGVNMAWFGKFGMRGTWRMVDYPVPHDDPNFRQELKAVLTPVVEEFLAAAAADEKLERAADPSGVHESYQAIKEIR